MKYYFKNIYFLIGAIGVFVILVAYFFYSASSQITITNTPTGNGLTELSEHKNTAQELGTFSGQPCKHPTRRPFAVMLGGDSRVRPLAGIGQADIVVEMPVFEDGVNRFMAVFQCEDPAEIGSIRSARHDFIPFAAGYDSIFAHWGGSHLALEKLDQKIIDNINALTNPSSAFYRKNSLPAPDNGFSTIEKLTVAAQKFEYRLDAPEFQPYTFMKDASSTDKVAMVLRIKYPGEYRVGYEYNPQTNEYVRFRGGTLETDFNTKTTVAPKNVVVMRATSRMIEPEYNDVDIQGTGKVDIYRDGAVASGTWEKPKSPLNSRLTFYDENRQEIQFIPGQIWINVISPDKEVTWTAK